MASRLLITGNNADMPRNAASNWPWTYCNGCDGDGWILVYSNNPSERPTRETCDVCHGDRVLPQQHSAHVYDLTAGRWISSHSGTTPGSGAAADLRGLPSANRAEYSKPHQPARPAVVPTAAGHLEVARDVITTALGLLVFGMIAAFFLILSRSTTWAP